MIRDGIRDLGGGLFARVDVGDELADLFGLAVPEVPGGWLLTRASWGAWIGYRTEGAPYTDEHRRAGCTVGVIGYKDRADAVAQIVEQERLLAEYRAQ